MQPGEALDVAAQMAVTLAGFAGIVVVFRPQSVHKWLAIHKFRLRLLLANSSERLASAGNCIPGRSKGVHARYRGKVKSISSAISQIDIE